MPSSTVSFKLPDALKTELQTYYAKYKVKATSEYIENAYVYDQVRITLYQSGKVLFQGLDAENEAKIWQAKANLPTSKEQTASAHSEPPTVRLPYVGCDETGVGDYFAPLVATACYLDTEMLQQIREMNIRDSKQLTDAYIQQIAPTLKTIVPYSTFALSNEQYNKMVENGFNANAIKAFLHNKALEKLFDSIPYQPSLPIVMDQFTTRKSYERHLRNISPVFMPTIFETKAENKYEAVAIASIICRDQFLKIMELQNEQYQMNFPLGAGKHVDVFAKKAIRQLGPDEMKKLVKYHFANTSRIF